MAAWQSRLRRPGTHSLRRIAQGQCDGGEGERHRLIDLGSIEIGEHAHFCRISTRIAWLRCRLWWKTAFGRTKTADCHCTGTHQKAWATYSRWSYLSPWQKVREAHSKDHWVDFRKPRFENDGHLHRPQSPHHPQGRSYILCVKWGNQRGRHFSVTKMLWGDRAQQRRRGRGRGGDGEIGRNRGSYFKGNQINNRKIVIVWWSYLQSTFARGFR